MRAIEAGIIPILELKEELKALLSAKFKFPELDIEPYIEPYLKDLKDDLYVFIEYPYVDKVYRNSFYHYFASKHSIYDRDCVRISFFNLPIVDEDFRSKDRSDKLQDSFLGYMVIRPTFPKIIGRSMMSPKAFKKSDFCCCIVTVNVMINGIKLKIAGFPHSSQDTETISCAETTIWSIMEYFGNKYSDYQPVLPSTIISALTNYSYERQIPSNGLQVGQISVALKQFGFGVRVYHQNSHQLDFHRVINYYIESGIPIIASLQNDKIGHAVVLIGHENIKSEDIKNSIVSHALDNNLEIIDSADIKRTYVVIDDNYGPYQFARFEKPTSYYIDPLFNDCKITSIVVPLYPKIYLDALQAHKLTLLCLGREKIGFITSEPIILRFFLTSSRSFKSSVALNESFNEQVKEFILHSSMPKFIWVAELSNKDHYIDKKAIGLIIIDATEPKASNLLDSLMFIAYPDKLITKDEENKLKIFTIDMKPFSIYINNLK